MFIEKQTVIYEVVNDKETCYEVVINESISAKMKPEGFSEFLRLNRVSSRDFHIFPSDVPFWTEYDYPVDTQKENCTNIWALM